MADVDTRQDRQDSSREQHARARRVEEVVRDLCDLGIQVSTAGGRALGDGIHPTDELPLGMQRVVLELAGLAKMFLRRRLVEQVGPAGETTGTVEEPCALSYLTAGPILREAARLIRHELRRHGQDSGFGWLSPGRPDMRVAEALHQAAGAMIEHGGDLLRRQRAWEALLGICVEVVEGERREP